MNIYHKDLEKYINIAIEKWGFEFNLRMVQEECAELITAINHYCRKRNINPIEEMVDVYIMMEFLRVMFLKDEEYAIFFIKTLNEKVERLGKRIIEN